MKDEVYVFRVKLSWAAGVWREIAILGGQTLHEFHQGILDAFEWYDNDTYRFYMSTELSDAVDLYEPDRSQRDTLTTTIDAFDMEEGHEFVYYFSSGERNLFKIRLMSVEDSESGVDYPDVVDERGDSPEQDMAY